VTTFEEEYKLSTFDKNVLRIILETKVVETTGDWEKAAVLRS
jgi:hypothetical protein